MKKSLSLMCILFLQVVASAQWFHQNSPISDIFWAVHFSNENTGTAVGYDGSIIRTIDGGNNWVIQNSGVNDLRGVSFVDINNGMAVGGPFVLRTMDDWIIDLQLEIKV